MLEKMKKIINKLISNKEYDKESCRGAVLLVEATIVFPIVFFVIFFIICLGNAYYVKAYMQSIAEKSAIQAANYARSETVLYLESGGTLMKMDLNPYSIKASSKLQNYMNDSVRNAANSSGVSLFSSMKPTNIGSGSQKQFVNINKSIFNSEVNVEIEYTLNMMPILKSMNIGSTKVVAKATARINDSASFVRNMDMVEDFVIDLTQSKLGQQVLGDIKGKIEEMTASVKKFFSFFKKK